jgi:hypothetical protein
MFTMFYFSNEFCTVNLVSLADMTWRGLSDWLVFFLVPLGSQKNFVSGCTSCKSGWYVYLYYAHVFVRSSWRCPWCEGGLRSQVSRHFDSKGHVERAANICTQNQTNVTDAGFLFLKFWMEKSLFWMLFDGPRCRPGRLLGILQGLQ